MLNVLYRNLFCYAFVYQFHIRYRFYIEISIRLWNPPPQTPPLTNGLRGTFGAETIFGVVFQKLIGLIWPHWVLIGPHFALFNLVGSLLGPIWLYWALFGLDS